ncbi:MAG: glycosyltransferase, partial [Verrucomicrobiota bacterium]
MESPQLSIIIATHNCLELTRACLESLRATTRELDAEWILVDDCSTDGTREFLKEIAAPDVRIHLREERGSFAINNNLGAKMARADTLCLLNNDTILHPGWWQPMLAGFDVLEHPGFIGNVQRRPKFRRYDHIGVVFSPDGVLGLWERWQARR